MAASNQIFFEIPELNSPHCMIVKNIQISFRKQFILTIWIIFTKLDTKEYFLIYFELFNFAWHDKDPIRTLYKPYLGGALVLQSVWYYAYLPSLPHFVLVSHIMVSKCLSAPKENRIKSPAWTLLSVNPATFTIRPRKLSKKQKLLKRKGNKELMSTNTWW